MSLKISMVLPLLPLFDGAERFRRLEMLERVGCDIADTQFLPLRHGFVFQPLGMKIIDKKGLARVVADMRADGQKI